MQKQKPLPVRPLLSRPLPTQQQQQTRQPLSPAPKTAQGRYRAEQLTDAEVGDLFRRLVALDTTIHKAHQTIAEARREQETIFNQARLRFNPAFETSPCSLCGYIHTGNC